MKAFSAFLLAIILWSLCANNDARATADTVKYRLFTSYLADSSLIRYELGSVGITSSGITRYLRFADSSPSTMNDAWKTDTFHALSPADSICFLRFGSVDDQHEVIMSVDTSDSTQMSAFFNTCKHRYIDSNFYVTPSSTAFDQYSSILYVVELRQASNNALIQTLDSTIYFLDDTSRLVWAGSTDQRLRKFNLGSLLPGPAYYLRVARYASLPSGASIIGDVFTIEATNLPGDYNNKDSAWFGFEAHWSSSPAFKIATSRTNISSQLAILEYVGSNSLELELSMPGESLVRVTLSDAAGRIVESIEKGINDGSNRIPLSGLNSLSAGCYFVSVDGEFSNPLRGRFIIPGPTQTSFSVPLQQQESLTVPRPPSFEQLSGTKIQKYSRSPLVDLPQQVQIKGYVARDCETGTYLNSWTGNSFAPGEGETYEIVGLLYNMYTSGSTSAGLGVPTGDQACFIMPL